MIKEILVILLASKVIDALPECRRLDIECLDYNVTQRYKEYEERQYPATRWISTTMLTDGFTEAYQVMRHKIRAYKQGYNSEHMKVAGAVPMRLRVQPCYISPPCVTYFIMSAPIPSNITNPPQPLDKKLFLEEIPPQTFVVRAFGGKAREENWKSKSVEFLRILANDTYIDRSHYYAAWYDQVYHRLEDRTNEIWFTKPVSHNKHFNHNSYHTSSDTKLKDVETVDKGETEEKDKTLEDHKTVEEDKKVKDDKAPEDESITDYVIKFLVRKVING